MKKLSKIRKNVTLGFGSIVLLGGLLTHVIACDQFNKSNSSNMGIYNALQNLKW